MLLRYTGPAGVAYPQVPVTLDDAGQPVTYAPFSFADGDVGAVIEVAVNPDDRVFVPVGGKAAKVTKLPDNDPAVIAASDAAAEQAAQEAVDPEQPTVDETADAIADLSAIGAALVASNAPPTPETPVPEPPAAAEQADPTPPQE